MAGAVKAVPTADGKVKRFKSPERPVVRSAGVGVVDGDGRAPDHPHAPYSPRAAAPSNQRLETQVLPSWPTRGIGVDLVRIGQQGADCPKLAAGASSEQLVYGLPVYGGVHYVVH
jgi:hypothetical protein